MRKTFTPSTTPRIPPPPPPPAPIKRSVGDWALERLEAMRPNSGDFDNYEAYLAAYKNFTENIAPHVVRLQRAKVEHDESRKTTST